jgi:thioredoxin-like negative regulator of GroEL
MIRTTAKEKAYEIAEAFFRGLLRVDAADRDARFALASTLFLRGQLDQAEQEFFSLLKEDSGSVLLFRKESIE